MDLFSQVAKSQWFAVFRVSAALVAVYLLVNTNHSRMEAVLLLLVTVAALDLFEKCLAPRQLSEASQLISSASSSISHFSIYIGYAAVELVPVWTLFFFFGRDLFIPYICAFAKQRGVDISLRTTAKISYFVHLITQIVVAWAVMSVPQWAPHLTATFLFVAITVSVASVLDYARAAVMGPPVQ